MSVICECFRLFGEGYNKDRTSQFSNKFKIVSILQLETMSSRESGVATTKLSELLK